MCLALQRELPVFADVSDYRGIALVRRSDLCVSPALVSDTGVTQLNFCPFCGSNWDHLEYQHSGTEV